MRFFVVLAIIFALNLWGYEGFRMGYAKANLSSANYAKTAKQGVNFDIQKGGAILDGAALLGGYLEGNAWNHDTQNKSKDDGLYSVGAGVVAHFPLSKSGDFGDFTPNFKLGYELVNLTTNTHAYARQRNANGLSAQLGAAFRIYEEFHIGAAFEHSILRHKSSLGSVKNQKFIIYISYLDF